MSKKLAASLLILTSLTLGTCGEKSTSTIKHDTGTNSATSSIDSSTHFVEEAAIGEDPPLVLKTSDDEQTDLLTHSLSWDNFAITEMNAEIEDEELQLELTWTNRTSETAKFSDLLKIQVFQNGDELVMIDYDRDLNELLSADASEDVEFDYHLNNLNQPLEVKITASNGDNAHILNINLE